MLLLASNASASKLMEVTPVDENFLMVKFRDGEVVFTDDGNRERAYSGHDYADGDEILVSYGDKLDVTAAKKNENWNLFENGTKGERNRFEVVSVSRKSKVFHTTHDWQYALDHWLFLKLSTPMKTGEMYSLGMDPSIHSDTATVTFAFDENQHVSEAIHLNTIGYDPESVVKSADLYLWLGDGGARDYRKFEGNQAWLLNTDTLEQTDVARVEFWKESAVEAEGRNLTGSSVWTVDFSSYSGSGNYRLVIDGVGCSQEFEISNLAYRDPFQYSIRGYYYMRIGEDHMEMTPVPRRPLFIPGKDPENFTIYITDLDPFDAIWKERRGDTWDECHFKTAESSMFWQHRLPGNPVNTMARGGHSDALDWDRHLSHVSNIYDLLLAYFLSTGELDDDDLNIAESGNAIPDIVDEARNEVDFFLSIRHEGGYSQGLTNPTQDRTVMFQAGNTTMAAWANAANCAMLADCFRIAGDQDLMISYRDEAIKAYQYAETQENLQLDETQEVGKSVAMRGRDFKQMAAAFLYNVTNERSWEDVLAEESVAENAQTYIEQLDNWTQIWATAAYLFTPRERHYPDLYEKMKSCIRFQAFEENVKWMHIRPSRRSSNNNWWQTAQNLHMVILAHAVSDSIEERKELEKSMILEADWSLGRNPSNTVEMTGLGERHIVNCFTSGRNDGTPGLHPGHTPYNNIAPWGKTHIGGNPEWFTERGYPAWDEGWPFQEAFFNSRYSWANAEFTPRETMRGKTLLYSYLYALSK